LTKIATEPGRAATLGLGSGLGPWVGARVAPQQSPILRPGRSSGGKARHHRSVPTYLYRGNGNDPPALSIEPLPTCLRSTESASMLQRLQHLAQTLILDGKAVTELRSREHHAAGQAIQHSLLKTVGLSVQDEPDRTVLVLRYSL
jgi:hypothetical protein